MEEEGEKERERGEREKREKRERRNRIRRERGEREKKATEKEREGRISPRDGTFRRERERIPVVRWRRDSSVEREFPSRERIPVAKCVWASPCLPLSPSFSASLSLSRSSGPPPLSFQSALGLSRGIYHSSKMEKKIAPR